MTPRLPRGISGRSFMSYAERLGYAYSRGSGSHIILTTQSHGQHSICVPDHKELSLGTLNDIINEICRHHQLSKVEALQILFG